MASDLTATYPFSQISYWMDSPGILHQGILGDFAMVSGTLYAFYPTQTYTLTFSDASSQAYAINSLVRLQVHTVTL